jgi:hypothetical protein
LNCTAARVRREFNRLFRGNAPAAPKGCGGEHVPTDGDIAWTFSTSESGRVRGLRYNVAHEEDLSPRTPYSHFGVSA